MVGLAILEQDSAHIISKACFLRSPSQTQIAHESTRASGYPIISPDGQLLGHIYQPSTVWVVRRCLLSGICQFTRREGSEFGIPAVAAVPRTAWSNFSLTLEPT